MAATLREGELGLIDRICMASIVRGAVAERRRRALTPCMTAKCWRAAAAGEAKIVAGIIMKAILGRNKRPRRSSATPLLALALQPRVSCIFGGTALRLVTLGGNAGK